MLGQAGYFDSSSEGKTNLQSWNKTFRDNFPTFTCYILPTCPPRSRNRAHLVWTLWQDGSHMVIIGLITPSFHIWWPLHHVDLSKSPAGSLSLASNTYERNTGLWIPLLIFLLLVASDSLASSNERSCQWKHLSFLVSTDLPKLTSKKRIWSPQI